MNTNERILMEVPAEVAVQMETEGVGTFGVREMDGSMLEIMFSGMEVAATTITLVQGVAGARRVAAAMREWMSERRVATVEIEGARGEVITAPRSVDPDSLEMAIDNIARELDDTSAAEAG